MRYPLLNEFFHCLTARRQWFAGAIFVFESNGNCVVVFARFELGGIGVLIGVLDFSRAVARTDLKLEFNPVVCTVAQPGRVATLLADFPLNDVERFLKPIIV
jgi:hypothetical protein